MRSWLAAVVAAICACRSGSQPLYPAGSDKDEGHGLLAQASTQFMTGDDPEGLADAPRRRAYGGSTYGGSGYGGSTYAGYVVPQWPVQSPNRIPKYNQLPGLSGTIEGTIALRAPTKLATRCGDVTPSRGAIIYIERVRAGRMLMNETRPIAVGGTIVKHQCTLVPTIQVVAPLPAALAIHGDSKPARLRIGQLRAADPRPLQVHELQAAGRIAVQLQPGVTRVDSESGALAAAWVVALDTPYYALTDAAGRFRIDELAPDTYEVTIWQAPAAKLVEGALSYGEPFVTRRTVKVDARRTTRLDVH